MGRLAALGLSPERIGRGLHLPDEQCGDGGEAAGDDHEVQPRSNAATGSRRLGVPEDGHEDRHAEGSDSYEYVPTAKGRDISPVLTTLLEWGDKHAAPAGPPRVQVHVTCGHDAHPQLHCSHCGEVIERGQLVSRPGPGATAEQRAEGVLPKA